MENRSNLDESRIERWDSEPLDLFQPSSPPSTAQLFLAYDIAGLMPSQILNNSMKMDEAEGQKIVSVSSAFFPGAHKCPSDTTLRSSDYVLFYVSSEILLKASRNAFTGLLSAPLDDERFRGDITDLPETSSVLNIILHTMYDISCARHSPTIEDLETAVNRLPNYGMLPKDHIVPSTALFDILLSHAPVQPIRVYSLAGYFDLRELAVKTSPYLLSYRMSDLTDQLATRMGATYLNRLMRLHMTLINDLKRIVLAPPHLHPATPKCEFTDQKKLSRAWTLAASYLAWDLRPDISIHRIQTTLLELGDHLTCDECQEVLKVRVKEVVVQWVTVKRHI